jgi:hypothetical protein
MGRFSEYRIHFNIVRKTGLLSAHSDVIRISQVEEYQKVFGCGHGSPHSITGEMYWQADYPGKDENAKRLAQEWLTEMEDEYPHKAAVLVRMLNEGY